MRQVCEAVAGLFLIVVFVVGWVVTGDFVATLAGLFLLLLFLGAVSLVVGAVSFVVGSLAKGGLPGFVLVLLGVSWLLGGEEDDLDC